MDNSVIYVVTKVEEDGSFSKIFDNRDLALAEYYSGIGSFIEKYGSSFKEQGSGSPSSVGVYKKSCVWPEEAEIVMSLGIIK